MLIGHNCRRKRRRISLFISSRAAFSADEVHDETQVYNAEIANHYQEVVADAVQRLEGLKTLSGPIGRGAS